MSIPPIQTRPIISQLTSSNNHSSPRAQHAQGEITNREAHVEKSDSFETHEGRADFAQDSAKLRRFAAQKKQAAISAPPTPIGTPGLVDGIGSPLTHAPPTAPLPPVTGDRFAPDLSINPTSTHIVPAQSTFITPPTFAPGEPPVLVDRMAPTAGSDPTSTQVIPSEPQALPPSTPAPLPPVVGDRLAPTPEPEKGSNSIVSSLEEDFHPTDSVDENDEHTNRVFVKADLDRLLGAFGRTSEQKGFASGLDFNADGVINASDLATLLSRFDASPQATQTPEEQLQGLLDAFGSRVKSNGPNAVYDLNGDGAINATDLAELLGRMSSQSTSDSPQRPDAKVGVQAILEAFNTTAGQPGFSEALDLNGDGRIDAADLAERLGRDNS